MSMKIAMFGGGFNPIHTGHIMLVKAFAEALQLDKVLLVPPYITPHKHKQQDNSASLEQKTEMCRLAVKDIPFAEVSDIEIKRQGTSYTYMTLEKLSEIYPDSELFLITGADNFMTIHKWKHPEIIFSLATICGVPRNNDDMSDLQRQADYLHTLGAKTYIINADIMTVSSTEIRNNILQGKSISGMVTPEVEKYILQNGLYKEG